MARKRFITSEISTDRKIAKLAEKNPTAAALWPWFITAFDDWGRMNADPIEVKLAIFPAFPYTSDDIETFIKLYHEFGIAYHYEVDGKPYLAVNPETWLKYQTYIRKDKLEKQKSKIPEPKDAPWVAKDNTVDDLATKNVAKQQSATINVLSPSPSPSPSPSENIDSCPNPPGPDAPPEPQEVQETGEDDKEEPKHTEDSPPYRAAAYLRNRILANNVRARVPPNDPDDKLMQKWAQEMDRLHRIGPPGGTSGYSWQEIRQLIDFSQDDDFWRSNILSAAKLREKCVQLENQMKRNNFKPRGHPTMSKNVANALRLVEKYSQEEGEYP